MSEVQQPPMPMRVANATTLRAMKELEEGRGKRFADAKALLEDLGA